MSGVKLTKAQRDCLRKVEELGHKVGHANAYGHRLNRGTLGRLEKAGLIHSERPFAGQFHHVTITPAGRLSLSQGGGE